MRVNKHLGACLTVVTAAAVLTGCGGGDSASPKASGGTTAAGGDAIEIKGFDYTPKDLTVKPGQEITVTNKDSAAHTVSADDKSFDTKSLGLNASIKIKAPTKPGKYTYICDFHQYMKGSITVS
jgi:plastocyanin